MKSRIKNIFKFKLVWLIILFILSIFSITIGVKDFNLFNAFGANSSDMNIAIVSRIPRLLSIIITGASLSISGLIMQTITQNKFVSPSTAGTMEWCKFGIMIGILFLPDVGNTSKMIIAFIFSLFGSLLFIKVLNNIKFKDAAMVPLIGMMLGAIVSSLTTYFAYQYDIIQNISSWLLGSFSLVLKGDYELLYVGIPFLILGYVYADKFTISGMGDKVSKNLGLNHKSIVFIGLIIVSLISSSVVVTVGSIPFVGLVIPNIISMFKGDNLKNNIFETAVVGSIFVLICDIIGRLVLFPYEMPVSVVISVIGSMIFLFLIYRRNKNAS